MKRQRKRQKGQAIVEYVIIVVIMAVAGLAILGFLSDTVRSKVAGIIYALGGTPDDTDVEVEDGDSLKALKDLKNQEMPEGLE